MSIHNESVDICLIENIMPLQATDVDNVSHYLKSLHGNYSEDYVNHFNTTNKYDVLNNNQMNEEPIMKIQKKKPKNMSVGRVLL